MNREGDLLPDWYHFSLVHICRAFDKLKEVRQLEYELDFAQNRARRDLTALQAKLDAMTAARCATRACWTLGVKHILVRSSDWEKSHATK